MPSIITSPLVAWSNPPIIFNNVVFPQPDGPKIETNSLSRKFMEIPFKALTAPFPTLYSFLISFKTNIAQLLIN